MTTPAHTPNPNLAGAMYPNLASTPSKPMPPTEHPLDFAERYVESVKRSQAEAKAAAAPSLLDGSTPKPTEPKPEPRRQRTHEQLAAAMPYGRPEVNLGHALEAAERATKSLDAASRAALQSKTWQALVREYGEERAPQALDAARALARSQPGLQDRLNATGAGDHPTVVMQLVRDGLKQRAQGRLK